MAVWLYRFLSLVVVVPLLVYEWSSRRSWVIYLISFGSSISGDWFSAGRDGMRCSRQWGGPPTDLGCCSAKSIPWRLVGDRTWLDLWREVEREPQILIDFLPALITGGIKMRDDRERRVCLWPAFDGVVGLDPGDWTRRRRTGGRWERRRS